MAPVPVKREEQVAEVAVILDDLKTERAQGQVDHRRAIAVFSEAFNGDFDEASIKRATDARVESARRTQEAVFRALKRTHEVLDEGQRKRLACMLRTGALDI